MRKLLALGILLITSTAWAGLPEWNYPVISSHSAVSNGTTVLFTSAPIRLVGITVGKAAAGVVSIYRSTSAAATLDLSTQTIVDTSVGDFFPMHDALNSSYTYVSKAGGALVTYWFRCVGNGFDGLCPGLKPTGTK